MKSVHVPGGGVAKNPQSKDVLPVHNVNSTRNSFADILKKPSSRYLDVELVNPTILHHGSHSKPIKSQAATKSFAEVLKLSEERGTLKQSKKGLTSVQSDGWKKVEKAKVKSSRLSSSEGGRPQLLVRSNSTSHSQNFDKQQTMPGVPTFLRSNSISKSSMMTAEQRPKVVRPSLLRSNSSESSTVVWQQGAHAHSSVGDAVSLFSADKERTVASRGGLSGVGRAANTVRRPLVHHPNRIAADTFHKIGLSTEKEKYVMAQDDKIVGARNSKSGSSRMLAPHMEVEFRSQSPQTARQVDEEEDDILIEFVDPGHVDQFVNKISAGTYRHIGNSESKKYVMSADQSDMSRISESKKTEQPALRDIHDMIREKMKRGEELTLTEREVLRQRRREKRRREKEAKRRQREEEKRHQVLFNSVSKQIRFISAELLNKVKGDQVSKARETESLHQQRRGIRFQDEEYPDLGADSLAFPDLASRKPLARKQQETEVSREVRDSRGQLVSDQDTGSDWETDFSDDGRQDFGSINMLTSLDDCDKHHGGEIKAASAPEKQVLQPKAANKQSAAAPTNLQQQPSGRKSARSSTGQPKPAMTRATPTSAQPPAAPAASGPVAAAAPPQPPATTAAAIPTQPMSYSAILKSAAKPAAAPSQTVSGTAKSGGQGKKTDKTVVENAGAVKKKVKSKDPVVVDLLSYVQEKKKIGKGTKQASVLSGKLAKEKSKKVVNLLDSTAPLRRRGKEREGGKKKRLSAMKKIILAEKSRKKLDREEAAKRREARLRSGIKLQPLKVEQTEDEQQKVVDEKEDDNNESSVEQVDREVNSETAADPDAKTEIVDLSEETDNQIDGNDSKPSEDKKEKASEECDRNVQTNDEVEGSRDKEDMEDKEKKEEKEETVEEKAKKIIHTRKYRDYCDQDLSKDLDTYVTQLMSDIVRFQDRAFANDPKTAKLRKRYAVGLRETVKYLKVKKVASVLVAPDLDRISSQGGLDCTIQAIKKTCEDQSVTVVYTLNRYKLGRCCARKVPVSCVAILNRGFQGSDENYKNMLELCAQLKESYAARLKIEIENIETQIEKNKVKPLRYVPGMDFVPRPASSLKYSPGKEFVPRSLQNLDDKSVGQDAWKPQNRQKKQGRYGEDRTRRHDNNTFNMMQHNQYRYWQQGHGYYNQAGWTPAGLPASYLYSGYKQQDRRSGQHVYPPDVLASYQVYGEGEEPQDGETEDVNSKEVDTPGGKKNEEGEPSEEAEDRKSEDNDNSEAEVIPRESFVTPTGYTDWNKMWQLLRE